MNLLIVDDEYLVVEEVVTVTDWELLGITEIYSATNAVSAVRILNEKKIDIMICDIEMPQTDGLELSKKAKENFPDLEIVMLTSHAEFNYVRNALRYGCYDYLLKPVMEDDIIKVMKNLVTKIERERHQAQLQEEGIVWNQYGKKNIGRKCSEDYVMIRTGSVKNMRRSNGKRSKIEG